MNRRHLPLLLAAALAFPSVAAAQEAPRQPSPRIVVTGEGAYDTQSAAGKVPALVTELAAEAGTPVALVAGKIDADASLAPFVATVALGELAGSVDAAIADPVHWLREAGAFLARNVRRTGVE